MLTSMNLDQSLAILGIAEVASGEMLRLQLSQDPDLENLKRAVRCSVYWPTFCLLVATRQVPDNWLPGALGNVVLGWAKQEVPE